MKEKEAFLKLCNQISKNTLMETLSIEYIDTGDGFLKAKMPVNKKVYQPMGLLHGGATVALAESVGSAASFMYIDPNSQEVRGIEISANHLRSVSSGNVFASAKIIHKGRTLHLWDIEVIDANQRLVSKVKLTNIIINK